MVFECRLFHVESDIIAETLNTLKLKCQNSNKKVHCAIRKHVEEWNGHICYGYTDFGAQLSPERLEIATEFLVFLGVSINESWKKYHSHTTYATIWQILKNQVLSTIYTYIYLSSIYQYKIRIDIFMMITNLYHNSGFKSQFRLTRKSAVVNCYLIIWENVGAIVFLELFYDCEKFERYWMLTLWLPAQFIR